MTKAQISDEGLRGISEGAFGLDDRDLIREIAGELFEYRTGGDPVLMEFVGEEELQVASIEIAGMTRKQVFNRLTYLANTGKIERLGYGRYRRPAAALKLETRGR